MLLVVLCHGALAALPQAYPPQPLASALEAFARATGYQLVYRSQIAEGIHTPGATAGLAPPATLRELLRGTGLGFAFIGERTIAIFVRSGDIERRPPSRAGRRAAASPTAKQAATGQDRLAEVLVTAARHVQNLQKVSATVWVIPGTELTEEGRGDIEEVVTDLPGVQATTQPGGYSIDIRGQGNDLPAGTAQGSVALEFDGVYDINSEATMLGFYDVNRIEVLAGPQSTRYGPNADGGVVNVITNNPVLGKTSGSASVNVGNFGLLRTQMAQDVPLGENLALRISAAAVSRDSYFVPAESDAVTQSMRVKLLFQPSDRLTLLAGYQLDHIGGLGDGVNGQGGFPISGSKVAPYADGSINDLGNPWAQAYRVASGEAPSDNHEDVIRQGVSLAVQYRVGRGLALSVLSSYTTARGTARNCFDPNSPVWAAEGSVGNCFITHPFSPFYQYTTEWRLHSVADSKITWDAGFYHWNYYLSAWGTYDPVPGAAGAASNATATDAFFGEATAPITQRLRLIAGLRESFDRRSANFGPNGTIATPTFSTSLSHFDYRAGAEYDLTAASMEYLTISTGYRPGGLTYDGPRNQALPEESEIITAFELGSKNRLLTDTLQVDIDAFYYIERNYQQEDRYYGETVIVNGQSIVCNTVTVNQYAACLTPDLALSAHELGLESEIGYQWSPSDLLNASLEGLDAHFDRHQGGPCAVVDAPAGGCYSGYNLFVGGPAPAFESLSGRVEPHAPAFTGKLGYRHTFALPSGATAAIGEELFYSTGYYVHPIENPYSWQPSYWTEGLTAEYRAASRRWSIAAYAHNLSSYAVKESMLPYTSIGEPRTFGLVGRLRW